MLYNHLNLGVKRTIDSCNFNRHIHSRHPDRVMDMHDMVYIKDGEWSIAQDDHLYELRTGDVILLQGGHHHCGPAPCNGIVHTRFIHFSMHPDDEVNESREAAGESYCFPVVVHCGDNPLVEKYFERVIYSFWADEPYERAKATAYLELLLCELSSMQEGVRSMADDIKLYIKQNPGRFISNDELAQHFCCSVRTITSRFRESTGSSPHAWQLQFKCRMADELMQYEPTITLKEVATTYGFCDEYHFGKCFKRVMGRSPKRAR